SGWAHATRGDQDAGIEACRRSVERSRDFNSRLAAIGWLGYAYLENGEGAEAARLLEWAVEQLRQAGYTAVVSWFLGWWSEALRLTGQVQKARSVATEGLDLASAGPYLYGVGFARRTLGRLARDAGDDAGAEDQLRGALDAFVAVE